MRIKMLGRIACSMLCLAGAAAEAQIGRQRPTYPAEPGYWVGLSIGYVEGISTTDEATGATWYFGYTSQLRATLEKTIARGTTFGVAAGYSTAPLTYQPGTAFSGACFGGCLANADIAQYTAFIRGGAGGATGFRGIYTAEGGVTQFSNFRERSGGTPLASDGRYDLTLGFVGGFAYAMSRLSEIYAEQSYDFVFHRQSTNTTNQAVPRLAVFRGGIRFGF
jgi:hypothetical protein